MTPPRSRSGPSLPQVALARWSAAIVLAAACGTAWAQATYTCHTEMATMRDGAQLATDVYLPASGEGRYPTILQRTPYNRNGGPVDLACANVLFQAYAAAGYAVLNQDVRGMYRSQGPFVPMQQEVTDGYDAVEWAAAQPWSTGKVGMTGGSYVGLTQWQPATRQPPHLVAISPAITASDYHDHWTYHHGVFDLYFAQTWLHVTFARETLLRHSLTNGMSREQANEKVAAWAERGAENLLSDWVWQLPLTGLDVYRGLAPYYYTWLNHDTYDRYWNRLDVQHRWDQVRVPAFNTGAWYDIFQIGTVRNFQGMREQAATEEARSGSKLIMTCCGHAGTSGTVQWGTATPAVTSELRFFDRYLKGIRNGVEDDPAVQLWVLNPPDTGTQGSGFWVNADSYPLPGTEFRTLFLHSAGNANTRIGDGMLKKAPPSGPQEAAADRYTYDPANPVPTAGGNMCCNTTLIPAGAVDQSIVELRNDVLVYTTEPLPEDVAVVGPVKVVLWAKSSAPDTDFTAKLVDVHLDPFAHNVLDTIVRARFREGSRKPPSLIEPGQAYAYELELGNAGTVFKKGHRIRLEISSSNFPHFARNLNTGRDNNTTAEMQKAHQTILHDAAHPSRLILPVAPVSIPVAAQ